MKKMMLMLAVVVAMMSASAMALIVPPNLVGDANFNQIDASGVSAEGYTGFFISFVAPI